MLQYGSLKDTYIYLDVDAILNDFETIRNFTTVQILEIREDGKKISDKRKNALMTFAGLKK